MSLFSELNPNANANNPGSLQPGEQGYQQPGSIVPGSMDQAQMQGQSRTTSSTLGARGLFDNVLPTTPERSGVGGLNAGNYAYTREVQPDALVEDRLNALTSSDSRYIQQARTSAARQAGKRGLLNSSIAAGQAEGEAIRAGLPIASQDAAAIDAARAASMDAENQGLMQTRDIKHKILQEQLAAQSAAAGARGAAASASAERAARLQMQREQLAFEGEQRGLDRAHQLNTMGFEYGLRNQFQDNETYRQDWMSDRQYNREHYGAIENAFIGAGIQNLSSMFGMLNQNVLDNPTEYDQEVYSGYHTTFSSAMNQGLASMMAMFFGGGEGG